MKKKKQMTYEELLEHVKRHPIRMTKWDVACFLIGYQGVMTSADWENIQRLYMNDIIDCN